MRVYLSFIHENTKQIIVQLKQIKQQEFQYNFSYSKVKDMSTYLPQPHQNTPRPTDGSLDTYISKLLKSIADPSITFSKPIKPITPIGDAHECSTSLNTIIRMANMAKIVKMINDNREDCAIAIQASYMTQEAKEKLNEYLELKLRNEEPQMKSIIDLRRYEQQIVELKQFSQCQKIQIRDLKANAARENIEKDKQINKWKKQNTRLSLKLFQKQNVITKYEQAQKQWQQTEKEMKQKILSLINENDCLKKDISKLSVASLKDKQEFKRLLLGHDRQKGSIQALQKQQKELEIQLQTKQSQMNKLLQKTKKMQIEVSELINQNKKLKEQTNQKVLTKSQKTSISLKQFERVKSELQPLNKQAADPLKALQEKHRQEINELKNKDQQLREENERLNKQVVQPNASDSQYLEQQRTERRPSMILKWLVSEPEHSEIYTQQLPQNISSQRRQSVEEMLSLKDNPNLDKRPSTIICEKCQAFGLRLKKIAQQLLDPEFLE